MVFFWKKNMLYSGNLFATCGLGLGIWGKCNPFLSHRTVLSETKRWISLLNSEYQILQNSGDSVQHISSSSHFFPTPSAHSQALHARHPRRCSERFLSCQEKNMNVFSQHLESIMMAENMTPPFLKDPQPRGRNRCTLHTHTHTHNYLYACFKMFPNTWKWENPRSFMIHLIAESQLDTV